MRRAVAVIPSCLAVACGFDAYDIRLATRDAGRDAGSEVDVADAPAPDDVPTGPLATSLSCAAPTPPGCGRARIVGGTFVLGNVDAWDSDAAPPGRAAPLQHDITVRDFVLDRYEVTVGRFRRFVAAMGEPRGIWARASSDLAPDCNWTPTERDREAHPMNCIDWDAASAFCAWDVADGRLPTEAQLEFAARGTTGRAWPWGGTERTPPTWVCWDRALPTKLGTCAVDDPAYAAGRSPEGVWHLAGNVAEWAADLYARYDNELCWGDRPRVDPLCTSGTEDFPAFRTGSWFDIDRLRVVPGGRFKQSRLYRHPSLGFRCAGPR